MPKQDQGETVAKLPWLGFRGKVVLTAALTAFVPWACQAILVLLYGHAALLPSLAIAATSIAAGVLVLHRLLEPIRAAAAALRSGASPDLALRLPKGGRDERGAILSGIADLTGRVSGLHHRWVQRHPLTQLPTREYLLLQMREDLEASPAEVMLGAVRFADYDRLAAFDAPSAEQALKIFAERLAAAVGKNRPLAHVDRDSFAIWFCNAADAKTASSELQAICYALGNEIAIGELKLVPEVEAGASVYPRDGSEPSPLVNCALVSLAKPSQTNAGPPDFTRSARRARELFALEQDLRYAISRDQLELHFQPVVDVGRQKLVGAEALLRWHHPQAGMIAPSRFVPIIEEAGLTDEIGLWTLNAACREARNWQLQGLEGLKVAVNLSATQLRDPQLKQMVARTLDRHSLKPQALEFELTETVATEDAERTFSLFTELRAMGISLAIDDFGSGYSSLSYVKNLPFDKLKIDREFVVKVHERRDSQAICRSLIELTRGLGIRLLAEGVERREEVLLLRSFGCTLFQGYYFSRPLPADQFIQRALKAEWPELGIGSIQQAQSQLKSRIAV